jgi:hypothetical protein
VRRYLVSSLRPKSRRYGDAVTWISKAGGERRLLDLYDISEGKAKNLVREAIKSGEVQTRPLPESECVYLVKDDGLVGFDGPDPTTVAGQLHENDFLYWAKKQGLRQRRTKPAAKNRRHASPSEIPGIVRNYLANAANPSEDDLIRHVREDLGLSIPRERLRVEYRKQKGDVRPGRPSKK